MFLYETGKALPLSHRNIGVTSRTSGQHYPQEFLTGATIHQCPTAAVTSSHKRGSLKQHKFYTYSCRAQRSKMSLAEPKSSCHQASFLRRLERIGFLRLFQLPGAACILWLRALSSVFKVHNCHLWWQLLTSFLWLSLLLSCYKDTVIALSSLRYLLQHNLPISVPLPRSRLQSPFYMWGNTRTDSGD